MNSCVNSDRDQRKLYYGKEGKGKGKGKGEYAIPVQEKRGREGEGRSVTDGMLREMGEGRVEWKAP